MDFEHHLLCPSWIPLVRGSSRHMFRIYLLSAFARFPTSAIMAPLAH